MPSFSTKLRAAFGASWVLVVVLLIRAYKRKVARSRELAAKCPVPSLMGELAAGYFTRWLPEVRRNYSRVLHFRIDLFNDVSEQRDCKQDTIQIPTPLFMGNPALLTRDPKNVRHMLKDDFDSFVKPSFIRLILRDFLGQGIFVINHGSTSKEDPIWMFQRKTASKIFTRNLFTGHVYKTLLMNTDRFNDVVAKKLQSSQTIEFKKLIYAFTLDSIGDIGFGVDFNSIEKEEVAEFSTSFDDILKNTSKRALNPSWFIFGRLFKSERDLYRNRKVLDKFSKEIISERRIDPKLETKGDILSLFMQADENLSGKFLRDVVMSFMIAGRDTTACTLSFVFFILATHPEIQETLFKEIANNLATDERITLNKLNDLPYLAAVVLETLRLFPPVPVDLKVAARDSVLPNGVLVRKGTICSYEPFVMGRDPTRYEQPGRFWPERWLSSNDPKQMPSYDQFEFPVFQAGQRFCLGKDLAVFEVKVLLVEFIKRFNLQWPQQLAKAQTDELKIDASMLNGAPTYQPGITLSYKGDLNLLVSKR